MQHYVGLDVAVNETNVCIVDKAGKVMREVKVATEPDTIFAVLTEEALAIERIGLEAGPLSQWLYSGPRRKGPGPSEPKFAIELAGAGTSGLGH
jgi:transposase